MATNKNALIRYRTIDRCLQNRSRRWTLENLIEACSDALYEAEGKHSNISRRTVQLDLQTMRSDKLGYSAPIEVYEKKYYHYVDPDYTISNLPLQDIDLDILSESVSILRQFKDFSLFSELNGVIQKLEDRIHREAGRPISVIHLDQNAQLKGLEHLDTLYQAILKSIVLRIQYKSFRSPKSEEFSFHGYILKEFNNRWFLVGRKEGVPQILTLALDRLIEVGLDLNTDYVNPGLDPREYYANTYGVTVLPEKHTMDIELKVDAYNAPYVLTKPFHTSQQVLETLENGDVIIGLKLQHNYELERLILGFGSGIQVLKPRNLRRRIQWQLKRALENYQVVAPEEIDQT